MTYKPILWMMKTSLSSLTTDSAKKNQLRIGIMCPPAVRLKKYKTWTLGNL